MIIAESLLIFWFFSYFSAYKCVRGSHVVPRSLPPGLGGGHIHMPGVAGRSLPPGYNGLNRKLDRARRS